MNKSEISTFTEQYDYAVDSRRYMGDINIDDSDIMSRYQILISENRYTDARDLLNNSDAFSFSAWFFNMLKNRLIAITDYLETRIGPRPELTKYQDPEPANVPLWTTWITALDQFDTLYSITVNPSLNGAAYSVPEKNVPDSIIQLYVNGDFGYALDTWDVISGDVSIDSDNKFVLGASDVVVKPNFKLDSMNNFPIHVSESYPTGLTSNGAVMIDLDINAINDNAIYDDIEPTGVPIGSCWIGDGDE